MSLLDRDDVWTSVRLGGRVVEALDLEHPAVAKRIIPDIEAGTKVYYDRRWRVSARFAAFLDAHPGWTRDQRVLVLGCGVGLEALAVARTASQLILNDLSDTAVELSALQLARNGFARPETRVGRYEAIDLPAVDLCIGSFLVYDADTLASMLSLMERLPVPILLANDPMNAFDDLVATSGRRIRRLTPHDNAPIVCFEAGSG